jgi:indolepyruvate ferredoxin oxidoreductase beta subunit
MSNSAIKPAGVSWPASAGEYTSTTMVEYLKANISKLIVLDGQRLTALSAKTLNVALLGAAAQSGIFPFDVQTLKEIIPEMIHERFRELNLESFETGRKVYDEYIR